MFGSCFNERCLIRGLICSSQACLPAELAVASTEDVPKIGAVF